MGEFRLGGAEAPCLAPGEAVGRRPAARRPGPAPRTTGRGGAARAPAPVAQEDWTEF